MRYARSQGALIFENLFQKIKMTTHWFNVGMLVCLLGFALGYDIASRRIPNWLVAGGLCAGVSFSFLSLVGLGVSDSLLGVLAGFAAMLPLYLLRAMGAGDVKLMAAVGAFLGPMPVLGAALLTFVAGGVLSVIVALWSGALMRVLANLRLMGLVALSDRSSGLSLRDVQTTGRLPYALAIAVGTGLQLWLATQDGWPFK